MYDEVYDAMVECKYTSRYDTPIYSTNNGSIATKWSQKFGLHCTHKIDHPEMCLVVDEVGSDLSQKGDGHIGGAKYACEKGTHSQNKVQHTDKHFTLLGFIALTGEPVLCLVILAGVQEILSVESGIDPLSHRHIEMPPRMVILIGTMGKGNSSPVAHFVSFRARKSPAWFVGHQRVPSPLQYLQRHWNILTPME